MKKTKTIAICAILVAATASDSALAHRSHSRGFGHHGGARIGLHIGVPLLAVPFYAYPSYGQHYGGFGGHGGYGGYAGYGAYTPGAVVIRPAAEPPVYVEQSGAGASGPASDGYWYYCRNPEGYYPSVAQCSGSWQRVMSQQVRR